MKKPVALLILWIFLPGLLWAGGTEGATPFNFLFLDANARPVALGGAYAAVSRDANALLYNPAGLGGLENNHITFQHSEHFQGLTQEYAALALKQGVGLMVNTLSFGSLQRTTVSNPRGTGLGSFGIRDWEISLGCGKTYRDGLLSLGLAVKYIREDIDSFSAQSVAADIGGMADLSRLDLPVSLGLAFQNIGSKARFQSAQEDIPVNVRMGLAYQFLSSGLLVLDANLPQSGKSTVHVGAEYGVLSMLSLRVGYNGRNQADSGITGGGGISMDRLSLDYAFVPFGDLGDSHRFSLSYRW